ncbi:MAG: Gfo/Idh/MocA family oxidoreductase [Planctomycetota bacterium]|nr:Gfo/Idh/MocA family oxidoreductase [Planctomycetota bacterium]
MKKQQASPTSSSRRSFLKSTSALAAGSVTIPYFFAQSNPTCHAREKNDRPLLGLIGAGGQGTHDARRARPFADIVAIADADENHANRGKQQLSGGNAATFRDYRKLLEKKEIDAVIIGTPDHWHTRICIDALKAGKDVYCEKPLTLTIEEGQILCRVVKETGRVFQVGTQQRSEPAHLFLKAIALIREGRIGEVKKVQAAIGGAPQGGPFKTGDPPQNLDWDLWLGQAPSVEYRRERCHGNFRWWYEYSGGKMTDWGAHHVDIAHWALGADDTGPVSVEGTSTHPVPFEDGMPTKDDSYNTATQFHVNCKFADGREIVIRHDTDNGCLIEGTRGRIFVNRGKLVGKAVDELKENPLPEGAIEKAYRGKKPGYHMRNFVECMKDRSLPISDVFSHHRALTTCHLANIAIRLGRKINWNPLAEKIVGDAEAAAWVRREQRKGYEISG